MLRFITLLALFGCALAGTVTTGRLNGRIVGGVPTTIGKHPHQVSLQSKTTGRHICGGSINSAQTIVTAAHCLEYRKASDLYIRLGTTDQSATVGSVDRDVESFEIHPGYNPRTFVNDVAVMKMKAPVEETDKIHYIQLADETPKNDADAVVTGWGTECSQKCPSSVNILREVDLKIVGSNDCSDPKKYSYGSSVTKEMVCAKAPGKDACQGDSGGPLVSEGKLVGVVSWGNGCADSRYPGVYASVPVLRGWIDSKVASL